MLRTKREEEAQRAARTWWTLGLTMVGCVAAVLILALTTSCAVL